ADLLEHDRLEEELLDDVVLARANRFAYADLARPLGDTDQHDVHDSNAGGQQRNRAHDECSDANRGGDLRERRDEGVIRVDLEIVILTQLQTARDAHRAYGLVERRVVGRLRRRLRRDVYRAIRRSEIVEL